jgi:hypothetical protein
MVYHNKPSLFQLISYCNLIQEIQPKEFLVTTKNTAISDVRIFEIWRALRDSNSRPFDSKSNILSS